MMYGESRKVLLMIMVISILVSIFPLSAYAIPNDISGYWAEKVVVEWVEKGLASGYTDGTFRPKNDISRAEFMTLVNNAFEYTQEEEIDYKDIAPGKWYTSAIKKAKAAGYISGYNDGTMKPDSPITREEVASIIARIMELDSNEKGVEMFKDNDQIKWSKGYIGAVAKAEYMVGFPDGNFKPQNNITRGEAIYALNNITIGRNYPEGVHGVAKQDFFGITYIHVIWNQGVKPSSVKANGQDLKYDNRDGKWKGTSLTLNIGDKVEILAIENGAELKETITVRDIVDK